MKILLTRKPSGKNSLSIQAIIQTGSALAWKGKHFYLMDRTFLHDTNLNLDEIIQQIEYGFKHKKMTSNTSKEFDFYFYHNGIGRFHFKKLSKEEFDSYQLWMPNTIKDENWITSEYRQEPFKQDQDQNINSHHLSGSRQDKVETSDHLHIDFSDSDQDHNQEGVPDEIDEDVLKMEPDGSPVENDDLNLDDKPDQDLNPEGSAE